MEGMGTTNPVPSLRLREPDLHVLIMSDTIRSVKHNNEQSPPQPVTLAAAYPIGARILAVHALHDQEPTSTRARR